jgi:hypothetical protein
VIALAVALVLALITGALALADDPVISLWRHAYHFPIGAAALAYGGPGILIALAAVLLYSPFVIPALERSGLSGDVPEGLVTVAMLLGSGVLSAALAIGVRRQRGRFDTLVAVQRTLEGEVPLPVALGRLRACLATRLDADVGLAVQDGVHAVVAGGWTSLRARPWPGCSPRARRSSSPILAKRLGRGDASSRRSAWEGRPSARSRSSEPVTSGPTSGARS